MCNIHLDTSTRAPSSEKVILSNRLPNSEKPPPSTATPRPHSLFFSSLPSTRVGFCQNSAALAPCDWRVASTATRVVYVQPINL